MRLARKVEGQHAPPWSHVRLAVAKIGLYLIGGNHQAAIQSMPRPKGVSPSQALPLFRFATACARALTPAANVQSCAPP